MSKFQVVSEYQPAGDQPEAIAALAAGIENGLDEQTLLGVTGSGKTFTMAKVIEAVQRPTLVLAHNKTLAAQLCAEFKEFFPNNAVEYFVSYYDYYQPEAYIPHTDTFIEKDSAVNEEIDRLRLAATASLMERRDVIVVSSVSCIYGLGEPEDFAKMMVSLRVGTQMERDSRFQAILPLWGKMLNVEKARADKVYGNDKLTPVITALGAGIGDDFDLEKLRYHKVIIMADADVDGSHIRTLLLTFFFRFMRPLIEHGYVYAAVPPLFKLSRGKTTRLAFSEEERDAISAELRGDNPNAKVDISRFKGLGEMNPHELWETTMDPERRTLKRIELDDAVRADQTFTVLMGEKVEPRKEFIERNAKYAVNLDY